MVERVLRADNPNHGYDALHDEYVDMIHEGERFRAFCFIVNLCCAERFQRGCFSVMLISCAVMRRRCLSIDAVLSF